jgi:sugar (pentulose or hexulose) kinase
VNWLKKLYGVEDYEVLNREAKKLPAGSEGLIVQEHFQGNRTPHTDPLSRGVFHGLTLKHQRAHLFRAVIEGVAFGSELILETMRNNGFIPERIVIAGGATRSPLWLQIHADVSDLPLTLTKVSDAPTLGCAILAAAGVGFYENVQSAADMMVQVEGVVKPNSETHQEYQPYYENYKQTYHAMSQLRMNLERK